ncbi:PEP-CTERM sorting domain-containing protein [Nostoc sp.]|uniref:PEP-CTERM sorting domain-containing protein n=1 Tax=Nostoc sp. TaxID=1180 RepID=UPI003594597A
MRTLSIFKTVSALAAASVVAVIASGGKASAITFNLGGPAQLNPGSITQSGIQLTSTASATPRQNFTVVEVNAFRTNNGLGILTDTNDPSFADNNQIDGLRAIETLTLTFNQAVSLTSVTFTSISNGLLGNDNFTFLNNGSVVFSNQNIPGGNASDTGTSIFNSFTPSQGTGTSFGFRAGQINDDFFISSVEVTATAVPEPITIAGMAMGSAFGVVLRRKYKKAAKLSAKMSS